MVVGRNVALNWLMRVAFDYMISIHFLYVLYVVCDKIRFINVSWMQDFIPSTTFVGISPSQQNCQKRAFPQSVPPQSLRRVEMLDTVFFSKILRKLFLMRPHV